MNNLALVVLDGRLVADPERKDMQKNTLTKFRVASNHEFGNADDKKFVSYFQVECWSKLADACATYLKKGSKVTIQGDLRQDRWEDSRGQKRSAVKVLARSVRFDTTKKEAEAAAA